MTAPDHPQASGGERGEVRLGRITEGNRRNLQRLHDWLLRGDETLNDGAPVVGALLTDLIAAFDNGITEAEARAAVDQVEATALHSAEDREGMHAYRADCPACRADRKLRAAFNPPTPPAS